MRGTMDEMWRVVVALSATAVVGAGADLAIRFIVGLRV